MKQVASNLKKGEIKVKVTNTDDLWYLSHIIDLGDSVKGKTIRKIKIGESSDRNVKIVKKSVFLTISIEKIGFSKTTNALRVSGKITEGPDDVSKGSYHSFNLEENSTIVIKKPKWMKYQLDKLKEACVEKVAKILIVVMDREEGYFAIMQKYGYKLLTTIKGDVQKKSVEDKKESSFYADIIKQIGEYDKRYNLDKVILASPGFFKEDLLKQLKDDDLKQKIVQATCSAVGKNGVDEVLKRDEVKTALHEDRISAEMKLVEDLLTEVSKDGKAAYGIKHVEEAANSGAVETLLVSDKLIMKYRDEEKFERLDTIMKIVDSMKANIHIISSEHDGGKKLDGLGGIGAILRYKLNY